MKYQDIISISRMSGLYELVSSKSGGAIVRSLEDGSTQFISSRLNQFTPLKSIEVYREGQNGTLVEVFKAMSGHLDSDPLPEPSQQDPGALQAYFRKVYPGLDETRVYISDMRKMIKWFGVLKNRDLLDFGEAGPLETPLETVPNPSADALALSHGKTPAAKGNRPAAESPKEAHGPLKGVSARAGRSRRKNPE